MSETHECIKNLELKIPQGYTCKVCGSSYVWKGNGWRKAGITEGEEAQQVEAATAVVSVKRFSDSLGDSSESGSGSTEPVGERFPEEGIPSVDMEERVSDQQDW